MTSRQALEAMSRGSAAHYVMDDDRIVARALGGMKIVCESRDISLTPHLVLDGFWESWVTVWMMRTVKASDRLLNIGANCGYFALVAARIGARVTAVEPQQRLADNIRISAVLNGFEERVTVFPCAAGDQERQVSLHTHNLLHGSAFVGNEGGGSMHGRVAVQEQPAWKLRPDATCVFMDAEGYEPVVWRGLKPLLAEQQLDWIALEWSPGRYEDPKAFLGELRAYGSVAEIVDDGSERAVSDAPLLAEPDFKMIVVRRG